MTDEQTLYCSFCAKSQHEVRKLIAGPAHVGICDECVSLCACIVLGELEGPGTNGWYLTREKPLSPQEIIKAVVKELRDEEGTAPTKEPVA